MRNHLFLFDDNKIKMARKPGKKQKKTPVGYTLEGKRWKGNIRERSRAGKTGTVLGLSLEVTSNFSVIFRQISVLFHVKFQSLQSNFSLFSRQISVSFYVKFQCRFTLNFSVVLTLLRPCQFLAESENVRKNSIVYFFTPDGMVGYCDLLWWAIVISTSGIVIPTSGIVIATSGIVIQTSGIVIPTSGHGKVLCPWYLGCTISYKPRF